jgi:phosphohistidine phosphatase
MKTLLIMRHAKSSWKHKDQPDLERPLNHRGEKDAPRMGRQLKKKELLPDLIVSSPAVRARLTAEGVADKCGYEKQIQFVEPLYMAEATQILTTLNEIPDEVNTLLLIGHNPGLEYTVQLLSHEIVSLPTAAIAYLKVPVERWQDLNEKTECKLVKKWEPKD